MQKLAQQHIVVDRLALATDAAKLAQRLQVCRKVASLQKGCKFAEKLP
jgi:hypothetical protein